MPVPRRRSSRACVASSSGCPPERRARARGRDPARRGGRVFRPAADLSTRDSRKRESGSRKRERGRGPGGRPQSQRRRPPGSKRDRIRSRDGETLRRRLRGTEGQIHGGGPGGTPHGDGDGGRGTGGGSPPGGPSSLVPRPSSPVPHPRPPPRVRRPVLFRVRLPLGERPGLLLALRCRARARRALLSRLWSACGRVIREKTVEGGTLYRALAFAHLPPYHCATFNRGAPG